MVTIVEPALLWEREGGGGLTKTIAGGEEVVSLSSSVLSLSRSGVGEDTRGEGGRGTKTTIVGGEVRLCWCRNP